MVTAQARRRGGSANPVYGYVTERILAALGKGDIPWRRPWFGRQSSPRNLISGKQYRGVNTLLLGCENWASPWFVTAKQAKDRGGNVRKGEHGSMVVFFTDWEVPDKLDEFGNPLKLPVLRYYRVFNAAQVDGVDFPPVEKNPAPVNPIGACETVWTGWADRPNIRCSWARACYRAQSDPIDMPDRRTLIAAQAYYSTLFHESIHATAHEKRLNRGLTGDRSSGQYAKEELVAEIGAAFLCGRVGIVQSTIDDSAAYCAHWAGRLKSDPKLIVSAAAQAQKAAEYILGELAGETADSVAA